MLLGILLYTMNGKKGKMLFNLPGNPLSLSSTRPSVEFTNVKSSSPVFDILLLQVFCMRLVTVTDSTLAHRQNTFWLGNMCTWHFRTMNFYQNSTAAALILHSWRATPERMVILKKKRHLIYLYSLPTWINFSPENIGCCEHDLQFPRINVFVAVVSPVKLKYIAKSKQLWVQL